LINKIRICSSKFKINLNYHPYKWIIGFLSLNFKQKIKIVNSPRKLQLVQTAFKAMNTTRATFELLRLHQMRTFIFVSVSEAIKINFLVFNWDKFSIFDFQITVPNWNFIPQRTPQKKEKERFEISHFLKLEKSFFFPI